MYQLPYTVSTIRAAGLEAKWSRTRDGAPIIVAREPSTETWYVVDNHMWKRVQIVGIKKAFEEHTTLGEFFSIKV